MSSNVGKIQVNSKPNNIFNVQWEIDPSYSIDYTSYTSPTFEPWVHLGKWHIKLNNFFMRNNSYAITPLCGLVSIYLYNDSKLDSSISFEFSALKSSKYKMFFCKGIAQNFQNGSGFPDFADNNILRSLLDNKLTINLDLELVQGSSTLEKPENPIFTDYLNLFNSSIITDFVLSVRNRSFKVHKAILAARSPVFASMFEHDLLENRTNTLAIEDIDPDIMEYILKYIYSGKCDPLAENVQEVLRVADKYCLDHLKEKCEDQLMQQLNSENVIQFLSLADTYRLNELKKLSVNLVCTEAEKILLSQEWSTFIRENKDLAIEVLSSVTWVSLKKQNK